MSRRRRSVCDEPAALVTNDTLWLQHCADVVVNATQVLEINGSLTENTRALIEARFNRNAADAANSLIAAYGKQPT